MDSKLVDERLATVAVEHKLTAVGRARPPPPGGGEYNSFQAGETYTLCSFWQFAFCHCVESSSIKSIKVDAILKQRSTE